MIKRNIKSNHYDNVTIVQSAVSNKIGKANLYIAPTSSGNSLQLVGWNRNTTNHITVPSITLEKIFEINKLDEVNLVKIDCEGSEGDIVTATPPVIWEKINKIVMEFHDNVSSISHIEIEKRLKKNGFTTKIIHDSTSPYGYLFGWKE